MALGESEGCWRGVEEEEKLGVGREGVGLEKRQKEKMTGQNCERKQVKERKCEGNKTDEKLIGGYIYYCFFQTELR